MKCVLSLLVALVFTGSALAAQGPCARKLLKSGDWSQDSAYFTVYLEALTEERVVSLKDLEPFLLALEQDKIINPIPKTSTNKQFVFHYSEFQRLITDAAIDITFVKTWAQRVIPHKKNVLAQKDQSKRHTEELPYFISSKGAMFYKISHPVLGESYKILKPGGQYSNQSDWSEVIWPTDGIKDPLRHKSTKIQPLMSYKNGYGVDPENRSRVPKSSPARKACIDLGGQIDLPTVEHYIQLMKYFEHEMVEGAVVLKEKALNEFIKLFKTPLWGFFWTSTVIPEQNFRYASQFGIRDHGISFTAVERIHDAPVRCVAPLF